MKGGSILGALAVKRQEENERTATLELEEAMGAAGGQLGELGKACGSSCAMSPGHGREGCAGPGGSVADGTGPHCSSLGIGAAALHWSLSDGRGKVADRSVRAPF